MGVTKCDIKSDLLRMSLRRGRVAIMEHKPFDFQSGLAIGLLIVAIGLLIALAGFAVYWLRARLGFAGGGSSSGCEPVLRATGAACWVQLLSGVTAASATGGWSVADWRKVTPHVIPERSTCPETLRPRVVQVLEMAMANAKDPFIAAHIRQILDALRR
jgi:hypothetical protein